MRRLEVNRDGSEPRRWLRADAFDWRGEGSTESARELDPVLDHLLFLRGERFLPPSEHAMLEDVLTLRFWDEFERRSEARIGKAPDGSVRLEIGDAQAIAARAELYADLLAILDS